MVEYSALYAVCVYCMFLQSTMIMQLVYFFNTCHITNLTHKHKLKPHFTSDKVNIFPSLLNSLYSHSLSVVNRQANQKAQTVLAEGDDTA